ncbi:unnamed protein product [Eruca vesicaria subsp. sativa]|uniref:Uncharacterized protein n=1 Tax=Eruca vesicaria subsp. sativa TaxID=29727 RepID=A0ABC8IZG6_ERUVS|nr:unnamed protein product [Eruca vesicaria subsp. sativa]
MFYSLISSHTFSKKALTRPPVTNGNSKPKRFFKRPFPPPFLDKRIIERRDGSIKKKEAEWVWIRSWQTEEGFGDIQQQSNNNSCSEPTLQMKLQTCSEPTSQMKLQPC